MNEQPFLQNKTAEARGKRDNDDQKCRRCLSTLHLHKNSTTCKNRSESPCQL